MDYYLNYQNALYRLKQEYEKYGQIIIAYDYDDTIFDFHNVGRKYDLVVNLLRAWNGRAKFICFSASPEERYPAMLEYITKNEIPCDKINESIEGTPEGRKVYYNILLDDRSGLIQSYNLLNDLLEWVIQKEKGACNG